MKPVIDLKKDKHAFMIEQGPAIQERLNYYTVPIYIFGKQPIFEDIRECGTGILVTLGQRRFIVTAGHCAKSLESSTYAISVMKEPHKFTPRLAKIGFRFIPDTAIDYGYAEIPPNHHADFTAGSRIFMGVNRMNVETSAQLTAALDRMIVAGYPGEMMKLADGRHCSTFFYNSTIIAGTGSAPPSTISPAALGMQVVDLSIGRDGQVNTTSGNFEDMLLPQFSGASGGGCWRSNYQTGVEWDPDQIKLSAIHIGSSAETEANGKYHRFARQVLIGHHLRLIADDYPDLRGEMLKQWPQLEADYWATGR